MKIRNKLLSAYLLPAFFVVIICVIALYTINFLQKTSHHVEHHIIPSLLALEDIRFAGLKVLASNSSSSLQDVESYRATDDTHSEQLSRQFNEGPGVDADRAPLLRMIGDYEVINGKYASASNALMIKLRAVSERLVAIDTKTRQEGIVQKSTEKGRKYRKGVASTHLTRLPVYHADN